MKTLATQPMAAVALVTTVTITGAGLQAVDITPPRLHAEIASVRLQAFTVAEPAQILTDVVKAAATIAGAAIWYVGFPITLPVSLVAGAVLSIYASGITMGQNKPDPLLAGLSFFLGMPALLVQMSLSQLGISLGLIDVAPPPAGVGHKQSIPSAAAIRDPRPTAAARGAKKPAAAHTGSVTAKRSGHAEVRRANTVVR